MLDYIKLPKYVSYGEYEVDSTSFKEDYFIKKESDRVLLIQKDYYDNDINAFFYVNEIAQEILKQYGETIFALVSINRETEKIIIIIGNSIDINNLNCFSFMEIDLEDMDSIKKQVSLKINVLKKLLNNSRVCVFLEENINEVLVNEIFAKVNKVYNKDEFKNVLSKCLCYEKSSKKNSPMLISSLVFAISFLISNSLISSFNHSKEAKINTKRSDLSTNLQKEIRVEADLKKKIGLLNDKISKTKLNNKFYIGE